MGIRNSLITVKLMYNNYGKISYSPEEYLLQKSKVKTLLKDRKSNNMAGFIRIG